LTNLSLHMVSDSTGETVSHIAKAVVVQFKELDVEEYTWPMMRSKVQVDELLDVLRASPGFVIYTLIDDEIRERLETGCREIGIPCVSVLQPVIDGLKGHLNQDVEARPGKQHALDQDYFERIEAMDYVLSHDDGQSTRNLEEADVILVGVSRCAKTPTCLYLAMNFSIKAANYPLTDDDLNAETLPDFLRKQRDKVVGLTIQADQLSAIREKRRPNSSYASLKQCKQETRQAENIMQQHGIKMIDSTAMSIEEIAITIVKERQLLKPKH